jgi:hypothetical protein
MALASALTGNQLYSLTWRATAETGKGQNSMAFSKMSKTKLPTRQWALVGPPGCGKSTFATQMQAPLLPIDADQRFAEVARLAVGDVLQLSDEPADNVNAERIAALLKENMAGSGVKTVVVDSLTSILTPLVVEAIIENDSGKNTNKVAAFKDKALAMRLLQDTITGWGVDVLWIYHTRAGLDAKARQIESTSISVVELARLRRSLNMQLKVITDGNKHGVLVEWARCGRSGMTLWDDSGFWRGMAEKIEAAVYSGLTVEDMERLEGETPTSFTGPEAAIAWGWEQKCFRDALHAKNAYDKVKTERNPKTAADMWAAWVEDVARRKAEVEEEAERSGEPLLFDEQAAQEAA